MGKKCNHPTCGDTCRRKKKARNYYNIPKVAEKRIPVNEQYHAEVAEYLKDHEECVIKSPVCNFFATCVNHSKGRESIEQLMNKNDWEASCESCNGYIEIHHEWAEQRGHKKKRHGHYKRTK